MSYDAACSLTLNLLVSYSTKVFCCFYLWFIFSLCIRHMGIFFTNIFSLEFFWLIAFSTHYSVVCANYLISEVIDFSIASYRAQFEIHCIIWRLEAWTYSVSSLNRMVEQRFSAEKLVTLQTWWNCTCPHSV